METVQIEAIDGKSVSAFVARPQGQPKGCIVVVQEIFGVNHHIRAVCDRLAALGYVAVAPAVFDRFVYDSDGEDTFDRTVTVGF
jgi:carboxymethylenebutenolidase